MQPRPALACAAICVLAAVAPVPAEAGAAGAGAAGGRPVRSDRLAVVVRYTPPLSAVMVVRPFEAPPTPYTAGHRGVDLRSETDAEVFAAAGGVVSFAGPVAGRGVVVLNHPDGVSTEYEPVVAVVAAGQAVRAGQRIGRVSGRHDGCSAGGCLHWGARRDREYFDPMTLLRPLGPVRLLPWSDH